MTKIMNPYQSRLIDLGWRCEAGASIRHHWHTRAGMTLAVSACDRVARQAQLHASEPDPKCALCEIMDTKRLEERQHVQSN